MSDQTQISAQIRFALQMLSERNSQHEWEHLCRHFARERICWNIQPATGPVQAGGDQGRDFETFHTYLSKTHLRDRSFVGLTADKPIAFACSLNKQVGTKVKNDVKTIVASGTAVDRIYYFSTHGVNVSKRHDLQEWCLVTYSIPLEILDAEAISELLATPALFWIASRFLQLPPELIPPSVEDGSIASDSWYEKTLAEWRARVPPARSFADFMEIRSAAYIARGPRVFDDKGRPLDRYARPELPFWIERIDEIANDNKNFDTLRRHAFFESCVLRLRGLGSLVGQEARLQQFFSAIYDLDDVSLLGEAEWLLLYLYGALRRGVVLLAPEEVDVWLATLQKRIDALLRETKRGHRHNEKCVLLEMRGHLALVNPTSIGEFDVAAAMKYWKELARSIKEAPLFPLERFADYLAEFADTIGMHSDYDQLTQAVDTLLAERVGQFAAADKCLQRANSFLRTNDIPRAMTQLHKAKIDWYAKETLAKFLNAQHLLSKMYAAQQLFFAAKYYALAGGYGAFNTDDLNVKSEVAKFIGQAATCDYAVGAWTGFLDLATAMSIIYPHYSNDVTEDFNNESGCLQSLITHLIILSSTTKLLHSAIYEPVHAKCVAATQRFGLTDGFTELCSESDQSMKKLGIPQLWDAIENQLHGAPWSDTGPERSAQWRAHGVSWKVWWRNDFETTVAAEGFLAGLQIVLSDLTGHDLCLMRTTVRLRISLLDQVETLNDQKAAQNEFDVVFDSGNAERSATVIIPSFNRFRDGSLSQTDLLSGTLKVVTALLLEVSLLPIEQYNTIFNSRIRSGLASKLLIGASYGTCLTKFVSSTDFDVDERLQCSPIREFVLRQPEALNWIDTSAPEYSPEKAAKDLQVRYKKFTTKMNRTLPRLSSTPEFMLIVAKLRHEGWKDWHILSMIYHVTINHRANLMCTRFDNTDEVDRIYLWLGDLESEPEELPDVPIEEYTEENLRFCLKPYMPSFARINGLQLHQSTPDFVGLEDFLSVRCAFWTDDIKHEEAFPDLSN